MTDTETITIEVTEQQYYDALHAINAREYEMGEDERIDQERVMALTNVWAQIYRGGKDAFREGDK